MERDGLTEEAACKRMEAQMTNTEYVSHANVVFSTQWEPEYTQKQVMSLISDYSVINSQLPVFAGFFFFFFFFLQVEKAWKQLQTRVALRQ